MYKNLDVFSEIETVRGKAKVRRIGPVSRNDRDLHGWAMLTVDLSDGTSGYVVAREDELVGWEGPCLSS